MLSDKRFIIMTPVICDFKLVEIKDRSCVKITIDNDNIILKDFTVI